MADPFVILGAVAAAVQFAELTLGPLVKNIESVKGAPEEIKSFAASLTSLKVSIDTLQNPSSPLPQHVREMLGTPPNPNDPSSISPLKALENEMTRLGNIIKKAQGDTSGGPVSIGKRTKWKGRLRWPFSAEESKTILGFIESYKSLFSLVLARETLANTEQARGVVADIRTQTTNVISMQLAIQSRLTDAQVNVAEIYTLTKESHSTLHGLIEKANRVDTSKLRELRPVKEAYHDHEKAARGCLEGTRVELLNEIQAWFKDEGPDSSLVFCLEGLAGTGKTSIAHSVCEQLEDNLGGAFFFSRLDHENRRNPSSVIPTLLYQLAIAIPTLQSYICNVIDKDPDIAFKKVSTQIDKLITNGIALCEDVLPPFLIVLDALDECDDQEHSWKNWSLLHIIQALLTFHSRIKIFLTRRPQDVAVDILGDLKLPRTRPHPGTTLNQGQPFILHHIDELTVKADIERYLRREFKHIRLPNGRPTDEEISTLVNKAGRLFIYAATAIKFISKGSSPKNNLVAFLAASGDGRGPSILYAALDGVYARIIQNMIFDDIEAEAEATCARFVRIIGTIVAAQKPLSRLALSRLLDEDEYDVDTILGPLFSLLDIGSSPGSPIHIFHPSFPDFLQNPDRCTDRRLYIDVAKIHFILALRCLTLLNAMLRQNICNIEGPGRFNSEISDLSDRLSQSVPEELQYACIYWATHLNLVSFDSVPEGLVISELIDVLHSFCHEHLLQWVEVLSLLGNLRPAVEGTTQIIDWLEKREVFTQFQLHQNDQEYHSNIILLKDTIRTVREYWMAITTCALQVYHTAVVFMPDCELYRSMEAKRVSTTQLVSARHNEWYPCLQVLEGHSWAVHAVAFSPDNARIASGSRNGTVHIWESSTGECLATFRNAEKKRPVTAVAHSPDGSRIFSGTSEGGIQASSITDSTNVWIIKPSGGSHQKREVTLLVVSPDSSRLAFAVSDDRKVYVCDIKPGAEMAVLDNKEIDEDSDIKGDGNNNGVVVLALAFSAVKNGPRLVSASSRGIVWLWNLERMDSPPKILLENGFKVGVAAFTPDILRVAFGYKNGHVQIQDLNEPFNVPVLLQGHNSRITALTFSNDGSRVASGSFNFTSRIWDATTGDCLAIFEGHSNPITSVAFSSNGLRLASGSTDWTVRIWDVTTRESARQMERHTDLVRSVTFSADGLHVASSSMDGTIRIWDSNMGGFVSTCKNKYPIETVAFSSDGSEIVFGDLKGRVKVWNITIGEVDLMNEGLDKWVKVVAFSPDGSHIAAASELRYTVKFFNRITKTVVNIIKTEFEHSLYITCMAFSPDNACIALGTDEGEIHIWNVHGAQPLRTCTLPNLRTEIFSVAFSSDGAQLNTTSVKGVHLYDTLSGQAASMVKSSEVIMQRTQQVFWIDRKGWLRFIRAGGPPSISLCWVPNVRRSSLPVIAWFGSRVALGSDTGLVTILDFSTHPIFSSSRTLDE